MEYASSWIKRCCIVEHGYHDPSFAHPVFSPQCQQAGAGWDVEDHRRFDAVGLIEVGDVAGPTKPVYAQSDNRVAGNGA